MDGNPDFGSGPQIDLEGRKSARDASRNSESNSSRIEKLERQFEKLSLITEALWVIAGEKLKLGDLELKNKIDTIVSERDRRKAEKVKCTSCNMQMPASKPNCIYCGAEIEEKPNKSPFDE